MKRVWVWLLSVCMALAVCGCQQTEPNYSDMIVPPLQGEITGYLSATEVEGVLGAPATLQGVFEDGSQMVYTVGDRQVTVNMQNNNRAGHDALLGAAEGLIPLEGMGEAAHENIETGSVLMFAHGYTIEVAVTESTSTDAARQLMQVLLSHLTPDS